MNFGNLSSPIRVDMLNRNMQIRNENNYTPGGEKLKSHGITYHDQVVMLYLCKFMARGNFKYNLTCEVDEAGKFDDVVIFYEQKDHIVCRLIQVKSKESDSHTLTRSILVGKEKTFGLKVYFLSYMEILMKHNFETKFGCEIKDLILHTNIDISNTLKDDLEAYEDEFFGRGQFYYLKHGESSYREALVTHLMSSLKHDIIERERKIRNKNKMSVAKKDQENNYLEYLKRLTLDEEKKHVNDFLDKLKFHVKQPNKFELSSVIKREINECLKKYKLKNRQDTKQLVIAYTNLYNKIYTFHNDPNVQILTDEDFFEWFKEASRCCTTRLTAFHELNMKFLTCHEFSFKEESLETLKRSIEENDSFFLNVVTNASIDFTLIKLNAILKSRKFSLITDQQFVSISETSENDIVVEKTEYLIVKCENNVTPDMLFDIENFLYTINNESENVFKKIILVSRFNDSCSSEMSQIVDETRWSDLHQDTRKKLEEEKDICLQGQNVKLTRIEISNFADLLKNEILYGLVCSEKIKLGKPIDCGKVCNISNFIERRISVQNKISTDIFKTDNENDVFMISNINETQFRKLQSSSNCQLIWSALENSENYFFDLCISYPSENVSWLHHQNGEFFFRRNKSIDRIKPYIIESFSNSFDLPLLTSIDDRLVLIVAEPGMGKSELLSVLARRTIEETPNILVIKINLNNYTKQFSMLLEEKQTFRELNEAIDFIIETQLCNTDGCWRVFEKNYFKRHFDFFSDKLIILFDGFDEIAPDYTTLVVDLIRLIGKIKAIRVWVMSRTQEKKSLKTGFNVLPYTLDRFTTEDQRNFFLAYWKRCEIDSRDTRSGRLNRFVERLIGVTSRSLRDNDQLMTGIPLQCRMLGEVYQEQFNEYYSSDGNDIEMFLPESLDILELYEQFIRNKWKIYEEDKLKRDKTITGNIKQSLRDKNQLIKTHSYLGLYTVFTESDLKDILSEIDQKKIQKYKHEIENGEDRIGIIHIVEDDIPEFIHRTFAEYFAAKWFHYRISTDDPERQKLVDFFKNSFFKPEFEIVRRFFDRLSARGAIFRAVLNNDEKSVIDILATDSDIVVSLADFNRTVLHLCAAYEYHDLIQILIQKRANSMTADSLCGWKPIEYACAIKNLRNIDTFLTVNDDDESAYEHIRDDSILLEAAENAHFNLVKYLIKYGMSPNSVNSGNETSLHLVAAKGHFEICRYLVEEAAAATDNRDWYNCSALHYATRNGHIDIIEVLVRAQSDVDAQNWAGQTPLHEAALANNYNAFKYLIEETNATVDLCDNQGNSVLHFAAEKGNIEMMKLLAPNKSNVNVLNHHRQVPLHRSAISGQYNVFKYLIEEVGAALDIYDNEGNSILHFATRRGDVEMVKLLVQNKSDVNVTNQIGRTALHEAAIHDKYDVFKYLIKEADVAIDVCDNKGNSVLHFVTIGGGIEMIKLLASNKLNINVVNLDGSTPLHEAALYGVYDVFEYLIQEAGAAIDICDNQGNSVLHFAARRGEMEMIKLLTPNKSMVNVTNQEGRTPLHEAAFSGQYDVFKYLIEEVDASSNICDNEGNFVLHFAAKRGDIKMIKLLALNKLNVNVVNQEGCTPLHEAAIYGKYDVFEYLIEEAGAKIDTYDNEGNSVLHFAAEQGDIKWIKLLDPNKSNVNIANQDGRTPLHNAILSRQYDIFKYLIEKAGAMMDICDNHGNSVLHLATKRGDINIIKLIAPNKLNVNIVNQDGRTALHEAALSCQYDIFKYLIEEAGATVDIYDNRGNSVFHFAAEEGDIEMMKLLAPNKSNANIPNQNGQTPLHCAAFSGQYDVFKYLIEAGATIDICDNEGNSVLHYATRRGDIEMIKLLAPNKSNVTVTNLKGRTPLHEAALSGEYDIFKYLIEETGLATDILNDRDFLFHHTAC